MELQNHTFFELIVFTLSACFTLLFGHNLWLVAKNENEKIKIEIITSDNFPESDSAVKPERIKNFCFISENDSFEFTDFQTSENSLVAKLENSEKARLVALELYPHPIVLEAKKFAGYIKSEDAEKFVAPNFIAGETLEPQRESYAKFAKVLINNESFNQKIGHKLEIILQKNPAKIVEDKLSVKVLFDNEPLKNMRVSSGAENINGGKYAAHSLTDENGSAKIAVSGKGLWFVRTHFILPHSDKNEFDWESFWASITFRV